MKSFFVILLLLVSPPVALHSETLFFRENTPIVLEGQKVGQALVLTPAELLGVGKSQEAKVSVRGFMNEGYTQAIQRSMQNPERFIELTTDDQPFVKILSKKEDDYGEVWLEVAVEFEVAAGALVADPSTLYAQAQELFKTGCSNCHKLHDPAEFSAAQWPSTLKGMQQFVGWDDSIRDLVTKYLQHNAKDSKPQ